MKKLPLLVIVALVGLVASSCATRSSAIPGGQVESASPPVLHTGRAPKPTDPLELTYLVEVNGLGLFEDERMEAEALVAAWASEQGLRVVPIERAREVMARARAGLHADTGESCGRPLAAFAARERWQAALGADGILEASVRCRREADECSLWVTAKDRLDWNGERVLERVAPFARDSSWREVLPVALGALASPPDEEGGGGGLGGILGGIGGGVVEARPERLGFSASPARVTDRLDRAEVRDGLSFPAGQAPLRACFERTASSDLLVEVGASGRVTRCASRGADDEVSRCVCEAFVAHASAKPGLRSRRLYVAVSFTPADVVTQANGLVSASVRTYLEPGTSRRGHPMWRPSVTHPSIEHWAPPEDRAIERCFVDVEEPRDFDGKVSVRFDARGDAVAVEVQPGKRGLSDAQRACVARAFEDSKAPCPAVDGAVARAELWTRVERIGDRRPSPFDQVPKKEDDK